MKILQYLNPPPPIGGVTISVQNIYRALKSQNIQVFYKHDFQFLVRYDVGHVHSSNVYKRFLEVIFLRFFCRKVVFTVHGLWLDNKLLNRICIYLCDGVIFLNESLYGQWQSIIGDKAIVLPSLYQEGVEQNLLEPNLDNEKLTLLLYSHSKSQKNGQEVYGITFALNALSKRKKAYKIILVDLDSGYSDLVDKLSDDIDIDYYPHEVNFSELISKCDIYLRPTCMDGSSVAIHEALLQSKRVIASDVVDRGEFVETYTHLDDVDFINKIDSTNKKESSGYSLRSIKDYLDFVGAL